MRRGWLVSGVSVRISGAQSANARGRILSLISEHWRAAIRTCELWRFVFAKMARPVVEVYRLNQPQAVPRPFVSRCERSRNKFAATSHTFAFTQSEGGFGDAAAF